jgi:hypothetical protein
LVSSVRGGDKFGRALNNLSRKLGKATTLRVGFLENAVYPSGVLVALVAAVHEFGAPKRNIPPRPFFRVMIKQKSTGWAAKIAGELRDSNGDVDRSLRRTGELIASQLQMSISTVVGPPLKPATVARKGFDTLLIDTAFMLRSVDLDVK